MLGNVNLSGIILTTMDVNEYDRRVTILTNKRGRISAFLKGARRSKSPLSACAPFTYGDFTLYEGRDSYNVQEINNARYFDYLRQDLAKTYTGLHFCEILEYLTREGVDEAEQMKLLYCALLALGKGVLGNDLVRRVFEYKVLCNFGVENPYGEEGSAFEGTLLYTLQFIYSTPAPKLFSFNLSDEVLTELGRVCDREIKKNIDRKLRSLEILETIL